MIQRLGYFLQVLAFSIVFGHNLSPHCHEDEDHVALHCADEHQEESILEYMLEHLLHANVGEDHLEAFQKNTTPFLFAFVAVQDNAVLDVEQFSSRPIHSYLDGAWSPPLFQRPALRGPPLV